MGGKKQRITKSDVGAILPAPGQSDIHLLFEFTKIFNNAGTTARFTGNTGVSPVQNKPMMAVDFKLGGHHFQ